MSTIFDSFTKTVKMAPRGAILTPHNTTPHHTTPPAGFFRGHPLLAQWPAAWPAYIDSLATLFLRESGALRRFSEISEINGLLRSLIGRSHLPTRGREVGSEQSSDP